MQMLLVAEVPPEHLAYQLAPVLDNLFYLFLPATTSIAGPMDDAIIAVLLAIPKHPDTRASPQWKTS